MLVPEKNFPSNPPYLPPISRPWKALKHLFYLTLILFACFSWKYCRREFYKLEFLYMVFFRSKFNSVSQVRGELLSALISQTILNGLNQQFRGAPKVEFSQFRATPTFILNRPRNFRPIQSPPLEITLLQTILGSPKKTIFLKIFKCPRNVLI